MAELPWRPAKIFVSYSHKDDRFRAALFEALSPLRRRGLIKEWYDGKLTPGDEFDPEISRQLSKANIIVLLLSNSYVHSDYCWNKEMKAAAELRFGRDDVRVVGIVVRPVHLEGTDLSRHKLLPRNKKAVELWRPQSLAWENVCIGMEEVIADLSFPSQVDDALDVPKTIVAAASDSALHIRAKRKRAGRIRELRSVSEFWETRGSAVIPGRIVAVQGTFSQFAPMLIGTPRAKRDLHKAFRSALEQDQSLRRRKGRSIDACMSVSAGQMVWRLREAQSAHIYCGLYNSIVRNSIPVLVERDYYVAHLEPLFRQAHGSKTFEARVTGRVIDLDNSPTKDFMIKHGQHFIPKQVVNDLCRDAYGIVVDGAGTTVERQSDARYLDGDIWIATASDGQERFLTSFLDVTSPADRKEELDQLFRRARSQGPNTHIIAQYDEEREFVRDLGPVSKNEFLNSVWRFGFGS